MQGRRPSRGDALNDGRPRVQPTRPILRPHLQFQSALPVYCIQPSLGTDCPGPITKLHGWRAPASAAVTDRTRLPLGHDHLISDSSGFCDHFLTFSRSYRSLSHITFHSTDPVGHSTRSAGYNLNEHSSKVYFEFFHKSVTEGTLSQNNLAKSVVKISQPFIDFVIINYSNGFIVNN